MSQSIEDSVRALAREVRSKLSEQDVPYMSLSITMTGSMTGGINISYRLTNADGFSAIAVEGNSVQSVVSEFLRQHSWKKWNRPEMISHIPPTEEYAPVEPDVLKSPRDDDDDDEIPF